MISKVQQRSLAKNLILLQRISGEYKYHSQEDGVACFRKGDYVIMRHTQGKQVDLGSKSKISSFVHQLLDPTDCLVAHLLEIRE